MRQRTEVIDGVIYFDLSDLDLEGYNKFIPYMLHPDARYFGQRDRVADALQKFPSVRIRGIRIPRSTIWQHLRKNTVAVDIRRVSAILFLNRKTLNGRRYVAKESRRNRRKETAPLMAGCRVRALRGRRHSAGFPLAELLWRASGASGDLEPT